MAVFLGPFDPLRLIINLMNLLMSKGILNSSETRQVLFNSMKPDMPEEEKNRILDNMSARR